MDVYILCDLTVQYVHDVMDVYLLGDLPVEPALTSVCRVTLLLNMHGRLAWLLCTYSRVPVAYVAVWHNGRISLGDLLA